MVRETRQKEQARTQPERRKQEVVQREGSSHSNSDVPTTSNSAAMAGLKAPSQTAKSFITPSSNGVKQQQNGSDRSEISSTLSSTREDIMGLYKDLLNVFVEVRDPSKPSSSSVDVQQASTLTDQPCYDLGHVVPYKKRVVGSEWQASFIRTQANFYERIVMGRGAPKDKKSSPTSSEVEGNPSVKTSTSSETQTSDLVPPQQPPTNGTKDPVPEKKSSKKAPEALPTSSGAKENPNVKASTSSGNQNSNTTAPEKSSTNGTEALISGESAPSKTSKKVSTLKSPSFIAPNAEAGPSKEAPEALPTSSVVKRNPCVKASTSSGIQNHNRTSTQQPPKNNTKTPASSSTANPTVKASTLSRILHALRKPSTNGTRAPLSEEPSSSKDSALIKNVPILKTPSSIAPPESGTSKKAPEALPGSSRVNGHPSVKASTSSGTQNPDPTRLPTVNGTKAPVLEGMRPSLKAPSSTAITPTDILNKADEKAGEVEPSEALPTSSGVKEIPTEKPSTSSEIQNSDATAPEKPSTNGTEAPIREEPAPSKYSALFKKVSILKAPSSNVSSASVVKINLFKRSSVLFENLAIFGSNMQKLSIRAPISKGSNRPKRDRKARRIMDFEEFPVTERCVFAQRENRSKTVPIWEIREEYMNPVLPPRSKPFENPVAAQGLHPDPPTPSPPPLFESGEQAFLGDMEELDNVLQEIVLGVKPAPIQLTPSRSIEIVPFEIAIIGPQNGDASTSSEIQNFDTFPESSTPEETEQSRNSASSKKVSISTAPSSIAPNPEEVPSNEAHEALPTSSGVNGNPIEEPSTSSETQTSDRVPPQQPPTNCTKDEVPRKISSKKAPESLPTSSVVDPSVKASTSSEFQNSERATEFSSTRNYPEELYEAVFNALFKVRGNSDDQQASTSTDEPCSDLGHVVPYKKRVVDSEWQENFLKWNMDLFERLVNGRKNNRNEANGTEIATDSEAFSMSSGVKENPIEKPSTSSEIQNSETTAPEKPSTNGTEAPVREGIHPDTPTPPPHSESGEEAVMGEMEELDNVLQEIQLEANPAPIQLATSPSSSRETFSPEKDVSCEIDIFGPQNGDASSSAVGNPELGVLDAAAKAFLKIKDSKRRQNEPETAENSNMQRGIQAPKYVQNGRVALPKSQILEKETISGVLNQNTEVASKRSVETPQNGSSHSSSNVPTTSNSSELLSRSSTIPTTNRPEVSNPQVLDAPAFSALSTTESHATSSYDLPLQAEPTPKPQHQPQEASALPVSSSPKVIPKSSNKLRALLARKRQLTSSVPEESSSLPNSDGNASTSNDITAQDKPAAQPVLPVSSSSEVNTESSDRITLSLCQISYEKQSSASNALESSSLPRFKDNASSSYNIPAQVKPAGEPVFRKPMLPQEHSKSQQRSMRERKSKVAFTPEPMGSKEDQRGTKRKSEVAPTQGLATEPKKPPNKKRAPINGILETLEQEEPRKNKRGIIPPFGPSRKPFSFDLLPKSTPHEDVEENEEEDEKEKEEENQKRSKKETNGRLKYVGKYWFPKMGKECQIEVPEWKEKGEVKMDEEERDEKDECVWSFPNETKMDQSAEDRLFEQIETKYWLAIWRQFKGHISYGVALQHLMENNFDLLESLETIDKCLEKVPQRFEDICVEQARQFVQFQKDHQKFHKKQKYDYPQRGISHSYEATDRRELQETTLRNYHIGEIDSLVYQIHRFYMPSEEIDCKVGCNCHDIAELEFEPRFGCKNCTKHLRDTSEYPEDKMCLICQNYKELTGGRDRPVENLILDSEDSRKIEAWNQMERDLAKKIDREEFEKLEKEATLARWKAYDLNEEEVQMLTFKRSSLMKTGQNIRPISKAQFDVLDDEKKLEVFERIKAKLEPFSLRQFVTCKCKESGGITRYSQNCFPKEVEELVRIIAETKTAEGEVDVERAAEKLLAIEPLEELPCPKGGSPLTKEERMKKRIEHFLKFYKKKDQIWKTPQEIAQAIAQTTTAEGAADLHKAAELLGEEPELVENFLKKYKKRNKIWKPWPKNSFHKFKPRKIVPNQNLPTPFSLIKSISRPENDPSCIVEDHVATPEPESKHEAVEIKRAPSRVQTPMRRSIRMSMVREIESPEDVVEKDSSPESDQNPKEAPDAPASQKTSAKRGRGRPKGSKYSGPFADSDQDSEEDHDFDRRSQDPDFKPKRSRKRL